MQNNCNATLFLCTDTPIVYICLWLNTIRRNLNRKTLNFYKKTSVIKRCSPKTQFFSIMPVFQTTSATVLPIHPQEQNSFNETKHRLPGFCRHHSKTLLTVISPGFNICMVRPVNQCCKVIQYLQRSSWNQSWGK